MKEIFGDDIQDVLNGSHTNSPNSASSGSDHPEERQNWSDILYIVP